MPANLDRKQYRLYVDRLHDYDGVDLTPYEQKIAAGREAAEKQELSNMIRRARKVSREDYADLAERLRGDFLPGLVAPIWRRSTTGSGAGCGCHRSNLSGTDADEF